MFLGFLLVLWDLADFSQVPLILKTHLQMLETRDNNRRGQMALATSVC